MPFCASAGMAARNSAPIAAPASVGVIQPFIRVPASAKPAVSLPGPLIQRAAMRRKPRKFYGSRPTGFIASIAARPAVRLRILSPVRAHPRDLLAPRCLAMFVPTSTGQREQKVALGSRLAHRRLPRQVRSTAHRGRDEAPRHDRIALGFCSSVFLTASADLSRSVSIHGSNSKAHD